MPFFKLGTISLGPLKLQWFGLLVATGVLFGAYLMRMWAERNKLDDDHVRGLVGWTVVCGFIGAHLFEVIAYRPHLLTEDPLILLKLWNGISSFGGFIGGLAGFFFYANRHKLPLGKYGDAGIIAFVPGFTFGRMGCTVVHDHIGGPGDGFFMATEYPANVLRSFGYEVEAGVKTAVHHNLGFYELLYMIFLCFLVFAITRWKNRRHGIIAAAIGTAYPPVRFFLDYWRMAPEQDPRYIGLTFSQWGAVAMFVVAAYFLVRIWRTGTLASAPEPEPEPAGKASKGKASKGKASESGGTTATKSTGKSSQKGKSRKKRKKK